MRDFCNVAERDCIRLIVAQDLKESGIDVDSSNLGNFSTNMTQMNSSFSHNQSHQSNRNNFLATNKNILNISNSNYLNSSNYKLSNNSVQSDLLSSNHDSHLNPPGKVFGLELRSLEMVSINLEEQILTIPT